MNQWESYCRYFRDVWPILRDMSRRGIPIDESRRLELKALIEREDERVTREVQRLVPAELRGHSPKGGYKRVPKSVEGLVEVEIVIEKEEKCVCLKKVRGSCAVCVGSGIIPAGVVVRRWAQPVEFNPNSSHQVKKLMKFLRHPVPKHSKRQDAQGDAAETTEVKELERLFAKTKHPVYPMLIEKRQLTKVMGTYVDGWRPSNDGAVHTTYTFQTATWQTSSRSPNVQNGLKHGKTPFQKDLARAFNGMQSARQGSVFINFDFKSFHALTTAHDFNIPDYARLARIDIHSFVTCHFLRLPEREGLWARGDQEMKDLFARLKQGEVFKFTRDFKAKRCIAEDQLVLTNRGLVPIQNITTSHLLWDGVEWVQHSGVIYQGVKEVITYDGLTATPDHEVLTNKGPMALWEAASQMARLERTGIEGTPLRIRDRDALDTFARQRIRARQGALRAMREDGNRRLHISEVGAWDRMPELREAEESSSSSPRQALRCDYFSVPKPSESELQALWRKGYQMPLWLARWIRAMGLEKLAASFVPWYGDRQDRQQRPLRGGESKALYSQAEYGQSTNNLEGLLAGPDDPEDTISKPIWGAVDERIDSPRSHWRADYRSVYDIADAGPRFCYTVSGKIVANCILGIQFGMGYRKLYQLNRDDFESESEARKVHEMVFGLFPKLKTEQDRVVDEAWQEKRLVNKFGAIRYFYTAKEWSRSRQAYVNGEQAEQAVAFLPASHAFGHVRDVMLGIREKGWDERYGMCNSIHDSLLFHCPIELVEECRGNILQVMQAPSRVLVYPKMAPLGLAVEAEASVGESMAELK